MDGRRHGCDEKAISRQSYSHNNNKHLIDVVEVAKVSKDAKAEAELRCRPYAE